LFAPAIRLQKRHTLPRGIECQLFIFHPCYRELEENQFKTKIKFLIKISAIKTESQGNLTAFIFHNQIDMGSFDLPKLYKILCSSHQPLRHWFDFSCGVESTQPCTNFSVRGRYMQEDVNFFYQISWCLMKHNYIGCRSTQIHSTD